MAVEARNFRTRNKKILHLIAGKYDNKVEENSKVSSNFEAKMQDTEEDLPAATTEATAAASSETASLQSPRTARGNEIMDGFAIESLTMSDGISGEKIWESEKSWLVLLQFD